VAERSTISQSVQIGVETVPGTAVAAGKRLQSIGFQIGPKVTSKTVLPIGQKYPSLAIIGKEWSESKIDGAPVYTELPYIFASLMSAPTIVETMDAAIHTNGFKYTFDSLSFGDDSPKTYTVEQGSTYRAHRISNGIISAFDLGWSREECTVGGTMLGTAITDGVTLTATPTALPQVPVRPTHFSIYLDPSAAALGTTKLTRALKGTVKISDRFGALWVVDSAQTSFVNTIEIEPKVEFTLMQMADAAGMAQLVAMRGGTTKFMRIEAIGPQIYNNGGVQVYHTFRMDLAGQVKDVDPFEDSDGVYAVNWTFAAVNDATWGKAYHVEVTTTTATL
jgi:hypothetical protein